MFTFLLIPLILVTIGYTFIIRKQTKENMPPTGVSQQNIINTQDTIKTHLSHSINFCRYFYIAVVLLGILIIVSLTYSQIIMYKLSSANTEIFGSFNPSGLIMPFLFILLISEILPMILYRKLQKLKIELFIISEPLKLVTLGRQFTNLYLIVLVYTALLMFFGVATIFFPLALAALLVGAISFCDFIILVNRLTTLKEQTNSLVKLK